MQFVLVHVVPDQRMAFAGSREPCAVAEVCCVGQCDDAEQNKGYSAVLCEKINRSLKIPVNRLVLQILDISTYSLAFLSPFLVLLFFLSFAVLTHFFFRSIPFFYRFFFLFARLSFILQASRYQVSVSVCLNLLVYKFGR